MKALILFLSLFATTAFAAVIGPDQLQNQGQTQGQAQGQAQGQLQGQAQGQSLINAPNTNINNASRAAALAAVSIGGNPVTINEAPIPVETRQTIHQDSYTVKNVPNVLTGSVYPTAPCMGSSTIGGAGVGFGISVGSSWTDDECGIRETARSFAGMDMKADALAVLCSSKYAAVAPACMKK